MLLRENIYDALRSEILTCQLMPGEEIHEQDLAARYEVSRQPIREALLRLQQDRLVTVQPRQGYQVNPISMKDVRDLFQFRLALEPACVAAAVESASNQTLADLDRFRSIGAQEDFIDYNRAFHDALAAASGNARMEAAIRDVLDQADRLVRLSVSTIKGRDPQKLVAEHGDIIDAVQRRDSRTARKLISAHVISGQKRVASALGRSAVRP
ncbi:DNA-binding GntR family transcriptional regulator [Rhizobium sp. BK313]|uniref:GntR family transcriptional regulator n=1 Tax=Rhizobium sp. BK313 TaxID=2587081 RepID=UPI00105B3EDC|nr:GntR family transcriptional regulator [Rhizobium sp. BK313]MBB3457241.1 DNA-binding GntR family transcriptional regulator [Rhizobium sp. BK313]